MCLPVSYYLLRQMAVASEHVLLSVATTVLYMCPPVSYSTQMLREFSTSLIRLLLHSVWNHVLLDVRIHGILILKTYRNQISTLFHHFTVFFYTHFFRPSYVKVLFCSKNRNFTVTMLQFANILMKHSIGNSKAKEVSWLLGSFIVAPLARAP